MTENLVSLFVDGKVVETGLDYSFAKAKATQIMSDARSTGARVPVVSIRRDSVAAQPVDVEVDVAALLSNYEGIANAKAGAWRKFQSARTADRVELLKVAIAALANSKATCRLSVLSKALNGELLSINQIKFLIERSAELELTGN